MQDSTALQKHGHLEIADRFFKAIEGANMEVVAEIYTADAVVWHNYDPLDARFPTGQGVKVRENIALLATVQKFIVGFKYEVWFEESTTTGFVRQHLITGRTAAGVPVRFPVCIIGVIDNRRISAIYEYLDINHLPTALLDYFAELARR